MPAWGRQVGPTGGRGQHDASHLGFLTWSHQTFQGKRGGRAGGGGRSRQWPPMAVPCPISPAQPAPHPPSPAPNDDGNQTAAPAGAVATLCGRSGKYYLRSTVCSLGRSTEAKGDVDVDLSREGHAAKVCRRQALVKLGAGGTFKLCNTGRQPMLVNDVLVSCRHSFDHHRRGGGGMCMGPGACVWAGGGRGQLGGWGPGCPLDAC